MGPTEPPAPPRPDGACGAAGTDEADWVLSGRCGPTFCCEASHAHYERATQTRSETGRTRAKFGRNRLGRARHLAEHEQSLAERGLSGPMFADVVPSNGERVGSAWGVALHGLIGATKTEHPQNTMFVFPRVAAVLVFVSVFR